MRRYDSHLPMPIVGGLKSGGVSSFCSLVRVRVRLRLRLTNPNPNPNPDPDPNPNHNNLVADHQVEAHRLVPGKVGRVIDERLVRARIGVRAVRARASARAQG